MKILRQIATATIVLSLVAGLFFSVPDSVYAASKRSNKITVYAWNVQENSLCLNWNKIKSSYNGYAVFRNGKAIAHLNKRSTGYFDYRLGDGTLYKYQIKTYKTKKVKQYYNKKTHKWQKKKPAKKYRGKTRKIKAYTYKKSSNSIFVTTKAIPPLTITTSLLPMECTSWSRGYSNPSLNSIYTIDNITFEKSYYGHSNVFSVMMNYSGTMLYSGYSDGKASCDAEYELVDSWGGVVEHGWLLSNQVKPGEKFSYSGYLLSASLKPGSYTLIIKPERIR